MAFEDFTGATFQEREVNVEVEFESREDGTGEIIFPTWWLEQQDISEEEFAKAQATVDEHGKLRITLPDRRLEVIFEMRKPDPKK